jgi:hypothetical protein
MSHAGSSTLYASCTVELAEDNAVTRITIITPGAGFTTSGDIVITDGAGTGNNVTITPVNYVQVAMANGTLSDVSGTSLPIEVCDNIKVKMTILSQPVQTTAAGVELSDTAIAYTTYTNFIVA